MSTPPLPPTEAAPATAPTAVNIQLLPIQAKFLNSTAREVLYSGAYGAGKSWATCLKAMTRALTPGSREGLCRKYLSVLRQTTLRTLLEGDGTLPPALPPGTYRHNKSERTIYIHGGGTIVYFGMDDASKVGSYNFSGVGVDEAQELSGRDWDQLRGRVRMDVEGLPNQLYGACNPAHPTHHLARRFGLVSEHEPAPGCVAFRTKTTDNPFLRQDYIENLDQLPTVARRRYFLGEWCGSEGLVYENFDPAVHVRERLDNWARTIIAGDLGYTNPTALLLLREDHHGRVHVEREFYKTKQTDDTIAIVARDWQDECGAELSVIDPSAALLIQTMRNRGVSAKAGNNDVLGGIFAVQRLLSRTVDDVPGLTVDPSCKNLIREFESHEWQEGEDRPNKQFDHALDALRYGIVELTHGYRPDVRVIDLGGPKAAQPQETVAQRIERFFGDDD